MELVDLVDENRVPLHRVAGRYEKKHPGELRSVVHVCVFNRKGEMLIQKRVPEKKIWPNHWDVAAAGGVGAGESSRVAAEREFEEELGVHLDLTGRRPSTTVNFPGGFDDFFIVNHDFDLAAFHLQKEEVADVRWVTLEEALRMVDSGEFIHYPKSFLQFLYDMRHSFGFN